MLHLIVQASKYILLILFLLYTFLCFHVFRQKYHTSDQRTLYAFQKVLLYLIHFLGYLVLYLLSENIEILAFYLAQVLVFSTIFLVFRLAYRKASELLLNNMIMLLVIGMIMLTRLDYDKAIRQFVFVIAGATVVLIIPYILKKISMFRTLTWVYAAVGILSLAIVAVAGSTSYGAKLSISIAGISVQPSEFVKILFVFFIASMLFEKNDIRQVAITSVISAAFVLMLVASKDLGGALLYYVTYLAMIYVATRRLSYFVGGLGLMGLAAFAGYKLFSHVQTRVLAWKDPLSVIDDQGYQVSQSLFGIGTGSWFGLGLGQGKPSKIPVVEKDFIFSAIAEEMGGIFAICLLLVCVSCFFMMMNIAMQMRDSFYRLVALGLGTLYAMQVLLTVGGAIKFIPSTGVTLPLVSYGGSSLLSTMIIFGVVEGLYIRRDKETKGGETDAAKKGSANAGKSREGRSNKIE
jgi:cell division protein FtsW (lipid II flippase)